MEAYLRSFLNDATVSKFIAALIFLLIVIFVAWLIQRSISSYVGNSNTRYRLRKVVTFSAYIVVLLVFLFIFSDRLGNLTVALGVAGAGIAFALQEIIASFAGWFAIHFAQFYSTGDRVQLGGIKGDVIDISFLRTTLMEVGEWVDGDLYNGRVVRVANSFVFKEPVFNYSGEFPFLWDEIKIPVKYGCDHRLAAKILEEVTTEVVGSYSEQASATWETFRKPFILEDAKVEPTVTLNANDNWMEFTVRYVVDFKQRRGMKSDLFSRIIDEFNKHGEKLEFASATFHLVEAPPIDVRIKQ